MEFELLLDAIIKQKGLGFGGHWRLSKKSLSILVPILREKARAPSEREYYIIEEVKDKVDFTDTGSVDGVQAKNRADKPVFVRSGSQIGVNNGGAESQERSVSVGTVIFPEKTEILETLCIHASKPIAKKAKMSYAGVVPAQILSEVMARDQNATRIAIKDYLAENRETPTKRASLFSNSTVAKLYLSSVFDDLVGFQEKTKQIGEFSKKMESFLSKVPADLDNQVGMVVLDLKGVVGLEMFDHEDSWKAFSKSFARSYSDVLMREEDMGDVFKIEQEQLVKHILDFLKPFKKVKPKAVWHRENATTYHLERDNAIGEYTVLEHAKDYRMKQSPNAIHVIVTRKMPTYKTRPATADSTTFQGLSKMLHFRVPSPQAAELYHFFEKKGSMDFLKVLEIPQTWKDLENRINVSTRTLSKLAKNASKLGLVKKSLRETNGRVTYHLTSVGEKVRKKLPQKRKSKYKSETPFVDWVKSQKKRKNKKVQKRMRTSANGKKKRRRHNNGKEEV